MGESPPVSAERRSYVQSCRLRLTLSSHTVTSVCCHLLACCCADSLLPHCSPTPPASPRLASLRLAAVELRLMGEWRDREDLGDTQCGHTSDRRSADSCGLMQIKRWQLRDSPSGRLFSGLVTLLPQSSLRPSGSVLKGCSHM